MPSIFLRLIVAMVTFNLGLNMPPTRNRHPHELSKANRVGVETAIKAQATPSFAHQQGSTLNDGSEVSIVVELSEPNPEPQSSELRRIKLAKHTTSVIDLDLAESIDGQEITLNFPDDLVHYRILQRYRTSMSISAEGPHLDLIDWRHFDSPWMQLKSLGTRRFRTLRSEQMEDSKFPATTKSEIIKEVRRRVGNSWPNVLQLANDCDGPNDPPCLVMVSSIFLRIQKRVQSGWIDVGRIEVRIPMGC